MKIEDITSAVSISITIDEVIDLINDSQEEIFVSADALVVVVEKDGREIEVERLYFRWNRNGRVPLDGLCPQCRKRAAAAAKHTCPYKYEIHDDDSLCTCCSKCEAECLEDII